MSRFLQKGKLNSAPGCSCRKGMGFAPLSPWPTALQEPRNTALSVSLRHSPRRVLSCLFTIIAISGRAEATFAETLIHGDKSETGVARSPILRRARKLIRLVLAYGARAMPADTLSCLAPPIDACAASLHRFQRSAVTNRDCAGFHLTPRPRWSTLSTRMRELNCTEAHRADRQLLVAIPLLLPPTAPRTLSIFIFSLFRRASGKTRSLCARRGPRACTNPDSGFLAFRQHRCCWSSPAR